ncbi:hypothetical protein B484DRAFT_476861 [Ochromonadaceae sp. CCMP2298]|nr:hypothetical protein B484DRAFT_476861 [Ochromonadaceae sp. CCMP2298]
MHTMKQVAALALLLLQSAILCGASPLQLINSEGFCKSASQISKYIETCSVPSDGSVGVVDIVDCTAENDVEFINNVFDTAFEAGNGVSLDLTADQAVLYSSFDRMFSPKMCGSKAIDFQCSLPGSVCVAVRALDLSSSLQGFEQLFRRLLNSAEQSPKHVLLLVDERGAASGDYERILGQFLGSLWAEEHSGDLSSALTLKVVTVSSFEPEALEQAKQRLVEALVKGIPVDGELASSLPAKWGELPDTPTPALSPRQRESLYAVEVAYTAGLTQADVAMSQWQARIASGRTVGKFASRVAQLLAAVRKDFNQRTAGAEAVRERGERLRLLREHVLTSAQRLFRQQLLIHEFAVVNSFRKELLLLVASSGPEGDEEEARRGEEEQQTALRQAVFDFKTVSAELEDEALGFSLTEERVAEVTGVLEGILKEFPESPGAKLEEVKKVERLARAKSRGLGGKGRKKKGVAKALGVSLSLVGMLRPPGFGNLQGFVGYATSMLGLPLELLLGVQNDGDSPEIMGEDREYPILRMQPKVHFDVDL